MPTSEDIEARLAAYREAELRILSGGQESEASSGPDGRRTRRANLADIQSEIKRLEAALALQQQRETGAGAVRSRTVSPLW